MLQPKSATAVSWGYSKARICEKVIKIFSVRVYNQRNTPDVGVQLSYRFEGCILETGEPFSERRCREGPCRGSERSACIYRHAEYTVEGRKMKEKKNSKEREEEEEGGINTGDLRLDPPRAAFRRCRLGALAYCQFQPTSPPARKCLARRGSLGTHTIIGEAMCSAL